MRYFVLCFFLSFCLFLSWGYAQTLRVFAASSLTEAFNALATEFEAQHPGTKIVLNFAGSSLLATQLEQGASADIFASADLTNLLRVVPESQVSIFAKNQLTVIVANSSDLYDLTDLAQKNYFLVLAADTVPIGHYAREVLTKLSALYGQNYSAQVLSHLVSLENNVRQAAAKVELGEADATVVYKTDLPTLNQVREIEIPATYNVIADYPIAVLPESPNADLANSFLCFVSTEGQKFLTHFGFQSP